MKLTRKRGDTSNILQVFIQDSSSTTGAGLTGLVFNTAGLTAYYHRDVDTTATAITLATMTVGTFTSSGFKEIDATNMPGWYQFCPPDAALAASGTPHSVGFHLKGATNMAPLPIEVQLIAADLEDTVRLGLTALPNAAAAASGGLFTRGTGAGQINQDANGRIDVNVRALLDTAWLTPGTAGTPDVNAKLWNGLATVALPLVPTVAGRTLDVSAGGEAGLDWANLGGPTTVNNLTNTTTLSTGSVSGAVGSVTGLTASDVGAIKAKTDNLPSDPADASDIAGAFSTVNSTLATIASYVDTEVGAIKTQTDKMVFTVTNQLDVNVKSNAGTAITAAAGIQEVKVASIAANAVNASALATDAVNEIVDQVWEETLTDHSGTSGSTAAALNAAGAAGDPWSTALPGSYGSGTAGKIIGDNVNATISSRATQTSVDTIDDYVDTEVAAIKAKTDNLPSDPADASDIAAAFSTVNSTLATVASYIDTEVAAIKAKTDNLPASPAATGDIPTANQNADALLDRANAIETGVTLRKALRLQSAVLGAKLSGAGTGTEVFRNAVADDTDRVTATVDGSGNRTAITYNLA